MSTSTSRPHHWANSALFYYFLAILIWAPLPLGSNRDWSTCLLAGLLLAGLTWGCVLLLSGSMRTTPAFLKAWPALAALIGVQAWVALQLILEISIAPESTAMALLSGSALVAAFTLVLLLVDSSHRIMVTTRLMIGCGVFQAFFAGVIMLGDVQQFALLDKVFSATSASGTFVNRNHLAGFLEMNLALGTGLLVAQMHRQQAGNWREIVHRTIDTILSQKFRLRLYLAIMVIGLVLTRSRMGNTAFFSSLLVAMAVDVLVRKQVSRGAIILLASVLLIDLYLVGTWFGFDEVVARLQNTSLETEKRDDVALDSLIMWKDHFWVGTGADTFFEAYVYGGYRSPDSLYYRHAENDYLEFGSGFGFIGFGLLGVTVLSSLLQALRAQRRDWRLARGLGFACTMGITSILLHSFTDFNLYIPANSLWFIVLLGLAWVAAHTAAQETRP